MARHVVIGGGIVGASVAFHLGKRTDDSVVVYERDDLASATTYRATAMVGTAGPSPFHRMKRYGIECYNEFFADPEAEPEYRQAGRLQVATTDEGARTLQEHDSAESDEAGPFANSPANYIPGDELHERLVVPPLDTDRVEGALHRPEFGYVLDDSRTLGARELALEFVERARAAGARFEPNTAVTDIRTETGAVTGVETAGEETVPADTVVCAAGPWNRRVAEMAGLELPLSHVYSPVFVLGLPEPLPYTMPMVKAHESGVGIHPKRPDRVLVTYRAERGTEYDPDAVGDTAPAEHRETALSWAEELLPLLAEAELVDEWVGLGTDTPDGHPIVGRTPVPGLAVAATMSGIQYAPAVGRIVARQLVDDDPTAFHDAVALSRFEGYADPWADADVE